MVFRRTRCMLGILFWGTKAYVHKWTLYEAESGCPVWGGNQCRRIKEELNNIIIIIIIIIIIMIMIMIMIMIIIETEGFIIAAQDQSLSTRWYQHNIPKKPDVDLKCRLCGRFDETIDHLVSGCPGLAKSEYIHRHNKAAAHIHWKICKEFGIELKDRWYEHEPTTVTEKNNITILWDMPIHTDRTIAANRPDIVLKNKKDKTCLLIDMTVPLDANSSVKTMLCCTIRDHNVLF